MHDRRRFVDLADDLRAAPASVRLVGIDGCGGAGKTTFATRLARAAGDAALVHTDDFASHDVPIDWAERFRQDVVDPLLAGSAAAFHPYDWVARRTADELITIEPAAIVLIEGVGATRSAWRDVLTMRIWVECPRELRLQRGLERDGADLLDFWQSWMTAEDAYVATEDPRSHADLVVDGTAPSDEDTFTAVVSEPR